MFRPGVHHREKKRIVTQRAVRGNKINMTVYTCNCRVFQKKTTKQESLRRQKERILRTDSVFSVQKWKYLLQTKHCSQRRKKCPERGESLASVISSLFVEQEEVGAYVANNLPSTPPPPPFPHFYHHLSKQQACQY